MATFRNIFEERLSLAADRHLSGDCRHQLEKYRNAGSDLHPETDMEVFVTFLKDEVLILVTFEEHPDLMVRKEHDPYLLIVGIN